VLSDLDRHAQVERSVDRETAFEIRGAELVGWDPEPRRIKMFAIDAKDLGCAQRLSRGQPLTAPTSDVDHRADWDIVKDDRQDLLG
jgi:hypothetical protein